MTNNPEAYQLYSMGTRLMKESEEEKDFRMALNFFEEALRLDSNFEIQFQAYRFTVAMFEVYRRS